MSDNAQGPTRPKSGVPNVGGSSRESTGHEERLATRREGESLFVSSPIRHDTHQVPIKGTGLRNDVHLDRSLLSSE
jgi:hypothetical protein